MYKIFNAMSGYADENYTNACFIQVYWDIDTGSDYGGDRPVSVKQFYQWVYSDQRV